MSLKYSFLKIHFLQLKITPNFHNYKFITQSNIKSTHYIMRQNSQTLLKYHYFVTGHFQKQSFLSIINICQFLIMYISINPKFTFSFQFLLYYNYCVVFAFSMSLLQYSCVVLLFTCQQKGLLVLCLPLSSYDGGQWST